MNDPADSRIDVLCVGQASFDLTMLVDHHPGVDEKCLATAMRSCGGGPAANAAVTVARLGGKSALAAYLGTDPFGRRHFAELLEEGVNTDCIVRGEYPTPLSVILAKPNGDRSVINHKSSTPPLESAPVDLEQLSPRVVLFDGHEPLISLTIGAAARDRNISTILDAGSVQRGTVELLPWIDFLIASAKFSLDFTGERHPEEAIEKLGELVSHAVITMGKKGLLWKRKWERGHVPAFQVNAVDTTGAGDAFHGAFSLGVARGLDFLSNLKFSSAAAALCCTRAGARPGIPSRRELDAFLSAPSHAGQELAHKWVS